MKNLNLLVLKLMLEGKVKARIKKLREQSSNAEPAISTERALLITEFYKKNDLEHFSLPVKRALAFKYILKNKKICINEGELIVGERGPLPKATSTYPEICLHSLEDLEILDAREKVAFSVTEKTRQIYKEVIIPFWKNKTIREKIFSEMDEEWLEAYDAGIFTEFLEQRAPGHTVLGDKIYQQGFNEIRKEIRQNIQKLDFFQDTRSFEKREELQAMTIAAEALISFARRHSSELKKLLKIEKNPDRKNELVQMIDICQRVPARAPETFWQALQYYWFVHLGVIIELNPWDSFNPGRLDQHLYPFYKQDIEKGVLTRERAKELLQAFWIKFNNHPAPPKVGVTAQESNTYADFSLINLGGLKQDGSDGVNELTFLILEVIEEMRLIQPSSMVQVSNKNPDRFLKQALKIIKTGFGQPSVFNTDCIIQELIRQGKSVEDARNGGASGCVESGAFGKECYILTGYFNMPKILEITLNNGLDPLTAKIIGKQTGRMEKFNSFTDFMKAFKTQMKYFVDLKIKGNNIIENIYAKYMPAPFLSILIDDCIKNGQDYNAGGARYNTSYIQGVGLGTLTDSLASIKYNIFDTNRITRKKMVAALKNNFLRFEELREWCLKDTPKYGNDDDFVDEIMNKIFNTYFELIDGRSNMKNGQYRINLLPTTVHIYFGSKVGALPDGRKAHEPLSEGISPVQGADHKGPTAVMNSVAKMDHIKTGGTLLNLKFTPQLLNDDQGITKLLHLIRTFFKKDAHHVQFNVVTADTLRAAQLNPEKYRNLIVRVAGYSDYFVDLSEELQNEIIKRTEHGNL